MPTAPAPDFSLSEARQIALAAQGFDRPRPKRPPTSRDLANLIRRLGVVQLDFVNLVVPAHYQVPFSRVGPYPRARLDDLIYRSGEFTEQWAHVASIVPVETWPLLRHRMAARRFWPYGFEKILDANPGYFEWVLEQVRERGPLLPEHLPEPPGVARRLPESWFGTVPRATLEAHFARGRLAISNRLPNFARTYDLTERVLAAEHHSRLIDQPEAERELLRISARALGIARAADLADYFRTPVNAARPRIADLIESGDLRPVRVAGAKETWYLHRDAPPPRAIDAATLLSPFDPLIWFRPRVARLFEFEYRFEIFVPDARRKWGTYVLPFLLGDRLVARVDLKADREARCLRVPAAYLEPHAKSGPVAEALARELAAWCKWLDLDSVAVEKRAGFARKLSKASAMYNH